MTPITGTPVNPEQARAMEAAMAEQVENNNRQLLSTFGRIPISLDTLVKNLNDNAWPLNTIVHPLDFLMLTSTGVSVHKDGDGPYFYLGATKVRPNPGKDTTLDLSSWTPSRITTALTLKDF